MRRSRARPQVAHTTPGDPLSALKRIPAGSGPGASRHQEALDMAMAYILDFAGGTLAQYDEVLEKM